MSSKYKLTYFPCRWLAEPIRFIFAYAKVDYEDFRIESVTYDEKWQQTKKNYPFSRLPLLEWDGNKLSQSFAIARFVGKKFDIAGSNEVESAHADEYADVLKDVFNDVAKMWTEDEAKKLEAKENLMKSILPCLLGQIERDLKAKEGKYLVGNNYTWADFVMASYTETWEQFVGPDFLKEYPAIKSHQIGITEIPQIKEWIAKRPVTDY